jgi:hypothetical protein
MGWEIIYKLEMESFKNSESTAGFFQQGLI